ncbi:MAG: hypothetical protein AABY22_15075 [Nanoarchaeota archaeon]
MVSFLFDANVPIAFKKAGHFAILEALFSSESYDHKLAMTTINLGECKRGLSGEIEQFSRFTKETRVDNNLLGHIKKYANEIKKRFDIHTEKDADFHFVMAAVMTKPDIAVCNDRDLKLFFDKYKVRYGYNNIHCYTLANFLDLIRRSHMKAFTNKELLCANLNIYHEDELPSLFKNMTRAECFVEGLNIDKYLSRNKEVFGYYKNNVFQIPIEKW